MAVPIASAAAGRLESRFLLNAVVPTAVFLPIVVGVTIHAVWGLNSGLDWYESLPGAGRSGLVVGFLVSVWVVAAMLSSQWLNVVRLFEGYPLVRFYRWLKHAGRHKLARLVGIPGRTAHVRKKYRMGQAVESGRFSPVHLAHRYDPVDSLVLPTQLGNTLRAAEMYPMRRYGIDVGVFWTRLAFLLPGHLLREFEQYIQQYQLPIIISGWGVVVAGASIVPLVNGHRGLFFATAVGGYAIAHGAYALSLRSARNYGIALRSAFDVHRRTLADGWPSLGSVQSDSDRFRRIKQFVVDGERTRSNHETDAFVAGRAIPESISAPEPSSDFGRIYAPRLSLLAFLAVFAYIAVGLLVSSGMADPGAVARASAERFDVLTDLTAEEESSVTPVIALRQIAEGDVVAPDDAVPARHDAVLVVPLLVAAEIVRTLDLAPGSHVEVLLPGSSECAADGDSLPGQVVGISRQTDGQRLLAVAVDPDDAGELACVGLDSAVVAVGPR